MKPSWTLALCFNYGICGIYSYPVGIPSQPIASVPYQIRQRQKVHMGKNLRAKRGSICQLILDIGAEPWHVYVCICTAVYFVQLKITFCSALTSTASQPKKRPVLSLASAAALLWFIYMHAGLLATKSVGGIKHFIVNAFWQCRGIVLMQWKMSPNVGVRVSGLLCWVIRHSKACF